MILLPWKLDMSKSMARENRWILIVLEEEEIGRAIDKDENSNYLVDL